MNLTPAKSSRPPTAGRSARRGCAGFTFAEVLAALLFMAIVIPVTIEGLRIASVAGIVGDRKCQAARIAEWAINQSLVMSNYNSSTLNGVQVEDLTQFRWTLRNEVWNQETGLNAPRQLTAEVVYTVQGRDYTVRLTTLVNPTQQ